MEETTVFETENIIAEFKPGSRKTFTRPVYRYDYGRNLEFRGVELPETCVVHFSNTEELGTATTAICQNGIVRIPNEYLRHHWDHIFAFIFLDDVEAENGQTVWKVVMPVKNRPGLSDPIPTPIEESIICQAIAKLNDAVTETEELIGGLTDGNIILDGGDAEFVDGGDGDGGT